MRLEQSKICLFLTNDIIEVENVTTNNNEFMIALKT